MDYVFKEQRTHSSVSLVRFTSVHEVGSLSADRVLGNVDHQLIEADSEEEVADEAIETDNQPVDIVILHSVGLELIRALLLPGLSSKDLCSDYLKEFWSGICSEKTYKTGGDNNSDDHEHFSRNCRFDNRISEEKLKKH